MISNLIDLLKDLNSLLLLRKQMSALNRKLLSPQLLLLMLQLIQLSLLKQFLTAILVSTEGPVPLQLDLMAEHMRLQAIFDMDLVVVFVVLD